jgi:hypothetical protein
MVRAVRAYLFQIVMLSADAETFLAVYGSFDISFSLTGKNIPELVHTGVGKQKAVVASR